MHLTKKIMKLYNISTILLIIFIVVACGSKKDKIIGKWKMEEMKIAGNEEIAEDVYKELIAGSSFEFKKDGTFSVNLMGENQAGNWTLSDDAKTLTTNADNGQVSTFVINKLEKEKLVLIAQENKEESFTLTLIPFEE